MELDEIWKSWFLIVSLLLLGAVLRYRRFYWCYEWLCWLVAIFTYLYPIEVVSTLPYILAVCVCYVLGTCSYSALMPTSQRNMNFESNAENNLPLYIGERTNSLLVKNNRIGSGITERVSQLEKKAKWILVAKVPADNGPVKDNPPDRSRRFDSNRYNYLVIQAISREVRRGPVDFPLNVPDTDINHNYHNLNHVGWCNLRSDIPVAIRNGPKIPGYQSRESVISTASQMSNSTVYTYFKCMLSYRPHALIKYLLLLCCPAVYQCCSQPITTALPPAVVPTAAIINFIAVMEISMLHLQVGLGFTFIDRILTKVVQGVFNLLYYSVALIKCIVHYLFVIFIIVGIGVSIYYQENVHDEVNLAREPEAAGHEVADAAVSQIESAKIFEDDHMLPYVRRVAVVKSRDGLDNTTYREGYHGGLWQVDEVLFLATQNTSYPILIDKHKLVKMHFDIDWLLLQWIDLRRPLFSALATCLYECTLDEKVPSSINKQAVRYDKYYGNTKQKNATDEFVKKVKDFEANTSVCYRDIDLFIVLDSSESITKGKYEIAKKFVADFVSGFTIGENNVRVGLIYFSVEVKLMFDLNDSFNKEIILSEISHIPYLNSLTATGDAIKLMVERGFTEASGARPPNLAIPRVGIVLTDGVSNTGFDVCVAAQRARNQSIEMFAFGIGNNINDTELQEIAGSQERKFKIDSFDNMDDVRALIARGSCRTGIQAAVNTRYEDNLDSGKRRLFEYSVPEGGITIQVQVTEGMITLYGSHSNHDPSPVWHEYMLSGIHGDREIVISQPAAAKKKQNEPAVPFYCNLVAEQNSTFSVKAMHTNDI